MANKLIVHGCGGAGINISDRVIRETVLGLGKGFSEIEFKYIDSTDSNIKSIMHDPDDFLKVVDPDQSSSGVSGSGGVRGKNLAQIAGAVKDFINKYKYLEHQMGVYHMVIYSASGGTGSVAGFLLTKALMEAEIPVIPVVIGDCDSSKYTDSTFKTLQSLDKTARDLDQGLNLIYFNNSSILVDGEASDSVLEREEEVNKRLINILSTISLFLSGMNIGIDDQDMINFLNPVEYRSPSDPIPAGLYGLHVISNLTTTDDSLIPMVSRSLAPEGVSPDLNKHMVAKKAGIIDEPNVLKSYPENNFPLHIINYPGYYNSEIDRLAKAVEDNQNKMKAINTEPAAKIVGEVDTDTGLII